MKKLLTLTLSFSSNVIGITAVFSGLLLVAAHYFLRGILFLLVGLALVGLRKEGWPR